MEQIKPGTRCECRDDACCCDGNGHGKGSCDHPSGQACGCTRDAVLMVTVPLKVGDTFRYAIGADRPLATVESVGTDHLGNPFAEVGFWHGGRSEHGISTRDAVQRDPMCEACAAFHESKVAL